MSEYSRAVMMLAFSRQFNTIWSVVKKSNLEIPLKSIFF
jgi:hypothetical protein